LIVKDDAIPFTEGELWSSCDAGGFGSGRTGIRVIFFLPRLFRRANGRRIFTFISNVYRLRDSLALDIFNFLNFGFLF